MTPPDNASRVEAGAMLLDEMHDGPEWAEGIHLGELHMESCFLCVLGQLFTDYTPGMNRVMEFLGLSNDEDVLRANTAAEHGFDADSGHGYQFEELDELWTEQVEARL